MKNGIFNYEKIFDDQKSKINKTDDDILEQKNNNCYLTSIFSPVTKNDIINKKNKSESRMINDKKNTTPKIKTELSNKVDNIVNCEQRMGIAFNTHDETTSVAHTAKVLELENKDTIIFDVHTDGYTIDLCSAQQHCAENNLHVNMKNSNVLSACNETKNDIVHEFANKSIPSCDATIPNKDMNFEKSLDFSQTKSLHQQYDNVFNTLEINNKRIGEAAYSERARKNTANEYLQDTLSIFGNKPSYSKKRLSADFGHYSLGMQTIFESNLEVDTKMHVVNLVVDLNDENKKHDINDLENSHSSCIEDLDDCSDKFWEIKLAEKKIENNEDDVSSKNKMNDKSLSKANIIINDHQTTSGMTIDAEDNFNVKNLEHINNCDKHTASTILRDAQDMCNININVETSMLNEDIIKLNNLELKAENGNVIHVFKDKIKEFGLGESLPNYELRKQCEVNALMRCNIINARVALPVNFFGEKLIPNEYDHDINNNEQNDMDKTIKKDNGISHEILDKVNDNNKDRYDTVAYLTDEKPTFDVFENTQDKCITIKYVDNKNFVNCEMDKDAQLINKTSIKNSINPIKYLSDENCKKATKYLQENFLSANICGFPSIPKKSLNFDNKNIHLNKIETIVNDKITQNDAKNIEFCKCSAKGMQFRPTTLVARELGKKINNDEYINNKKYISIQIQQEDYTTLIFDTCIVAENVIVDLINDYINFSKCRYNQTFSIHLKFMLENIKIGVRKENMIDKKIQRFYYFYENIKSSIIDNKKNFSCSYNGKSGKLHIKYLC
ncbi:hypothetical protein COBT_000107 [Conglomerata obtusa]